MGYAICKEGYPKNPKKKVALASPARIHVDEMDVCEIPIGRDDTRRSAVWLLYREWLYRRKKGRQKCAKSTFDLRNRQICIYDNGVFEVVCGF